MRRDAAGKFTRNWQSEAKRRVSVTLTNTAWQLLEEEAQKYGISRSEFIERTARSFAAARHQCIEATGNEQKPEPLDNVHPSCQTEEPDGKVDHHGDQADTQSQKLIWEQHAIATLQHQKQELEALLEKEQQRSQGIVAQKSDRKVTAIPQRINDVTERLGLALVAAKLGDWSWDAVTDLVTFSERAAEIFGIPPGPYMTWTQMRDLLHEDDRERARVEVERAIANHGDYSIEYRVLHGDGSEHWVAANGRAHYTPTGEVIGMLGVVQDITQRKRSFEAYKQAEQALRQSEERLRFALEAAGMVAWEWNPTTGQTVRSHTSYPLIGIGSDPASEADSEFFNLIHPDDRDCVMRLLEQAIAQKSSYCAEFRIIKPDGALRWMLDQGRVICNGAGDVVRMSGVLQDITTRKQAEEALRESQTLYQMLAEALPNLVWMLGPDGTLDYANQQWRDALGVTVEQVNQAGWGLIMHPDDLSRSLENWAKIQAGATATEREYRHRMADGSYRWFLARMLVIRDEQGRLLRLVGASTDIDERKRTEDALRSSEARLALASQAAKVGTFEWNIQTNEIFWTAEEEALYGLPPGSFEGQFEHWKQAVHPDDRDRAEQDVLNAVASRTDLNTEFRVIHPDGNIRWLAAKGRIFYDAENHPLRMIGMNEDITDRRRAEAELRQREQEFRTLVENTPDIVVRYDRDLRHLYINPSIEQALGIPPEQFIGKTGIELGLTDERSQTWYATLQQVFETGQSRLLEYEFPNPDGELRFYQAHFVPELIEGEQIKTVVSVARDVTEYKRAEAALAESHQTLQAIIQASPLAIMGLRADGTVRIWNPAAERIFGWSQEEVLGKFLPAIPDDKRHEFLENLAVTLQGQGLAGVETQRQKKGNSLFDVELWTAPVDETQAGISCLSIVADITERKRAELELQESQQFIQQIADSIPGTLYVYDMLEQCNVYVNRQIGELLGYTPEQIQVFGDQLFPQLMHPDDLANLGIQIERLNQAQDSEVIDHEYRMRHASGEWRWLWSRNTVSTRTPDGRAHQVVGTVHDITDRKRVQDELRESEQRLQLAQQAGRIGTWEWNLLTNEVSWSDGIWALLALEPNSISLSPESWTRFIHPDDREQAFRRVEEALAHGDDYYDEFRVVRQDGATCWFLSKGRVARTPDGRPERLLGINVDITDRKQAEDSLRQSEERYRYLAESIPQLVWTADGEGVLMDVNQRWSTFTGLTLEQAKTEGWEAVVHPEDIPTLGQNWAIAQQQGSYYQAEGRMRRADGVYRWHLHQAIPLKNEQGQLIKWFGTATDIEGQKQLEQQRIHLLEQEQAAREQAETANRIKDEFLAVLSHELRTPLNPILGWVRLLRTRQFDPSATDRALETIERNARLQAQLIEDLLDISRILQGKLRLNTCPVNLATVIEATLETVRLSAEAKGIQIQTVLDPEVGLVKGDDNRLQQVLWNLLSNAVKFTPAGGQVEVRLEQVGGEVGESGSRGVEENPSTPSLHHPVTPSPMYPYAQITVTDTGQGISPDFLPHVFEYFRQADSSTTRHFGGLGLGLAIARQIVELHGGTVKAESPGHGMGATFTVRLPLHRSERAEEWGSKGTYYAPRSHRPLTGLQILIVDDEADMRDLICFILEERGATVRAAATATEALQQLTESVPDVLISDIGMPEMDGYALMRQIRATLSEQGTMIPAIALTAYAGEINQQQAIAAGFHVHIAKPVDSEELVRAICQLCSTLS